MARKNSEGDGIEVQGLEVEALIGVPSDERATPQRLLLDIEMVPLDNFDNLDDEITHTVDYYAASRGVIALAAQRPRKLIETLAVEVAEWLLETYPLRDVQVRVRKFILDDAEHVGVSVRRGRS